MQLQCRAQTQSPLAATAGAPTPIEIKAFRLALDQFVTDPDIGGQAVVDVLLDFFASRCLVAGEMRDLGNAILNASNRSKAQGVTLGCFEERFEFRHAQKRLSVFVDDIRLATILPEDAFALADLLCGRDGDGSSSQHSARTLISADA